MFVTYLILKLALGGVVDEVNRLSGEQETRERARWYRSRLIRLRNELELGRISEKTYASREAAILGELAESGREVEARPAGRKGAREP